MQIESADATSATTEVARTPAHKPGILGTRKAKTAAVLAVVLVGAAATVAAVVATGGGGGASSPPSSPTTYVRGVLQNFSTAPLPAFCSDASLMTNSVPTTLGRRLQSTTTTTCSGTETYSNTQVPWGENTCVALQFWYASDVGDNVKAPLEKFTKAAQCVWGSRPRMDYLVFSASSSNSATMFADYCTDLQARASAASGSLGSYSCSTNSQGQEGSEGVGSDYMAFSGMIGPDNAGYPHGRIGLARPEPLATWIANGASAGGSHFIDPAFHEYFHAVQASYCNPTVALDIDTGNSNRCMTLGFESPFFVEGEADLMARFVYHQRMLPATPGDFNATMLNYLNDAASYAGPSGLRMEDASYATNIASTHSGVFAAGSWFVAFLFHKVDWNMDAYMRYHVNRAPPSATNGAALTAAMYDSFEVTFGMNVTVALDEFHNTFLPQATSQKMAILWTA